MGAAPSFVWHTYPLGLLGADQIGLDRTCHRSLRELQAWLPHIAGLGADALLLGPIFASLSHGYDTVTHHEVDDRLGDAADLDALIEAARAYGIGVVLDGAFAYASRDFWRLSDPSELRTPWFLRDAQGELVPWRVDSLVTPDYDSPGYQAYVVETITSWLDRGIVGWRLDSAWSVPAAFWRTVLGRVRQSHPAAWFLGQVFDDDLRKVVDQATYSSATGSALMRGIRDWLCGGTVEVMVSTLQQHSRNSAGASVHTFVGNHDVARLADVVAPDLLPAAFAVLLTVPGVPAVYYGDELALRSSWVEGGSDAELRPPVITIDPALLADGAAALLQTVRSLGAFRRSHPWLTDAALADIRVHEGSVAYGVCGRDGQALEVVVNPSPASVRWTRVGRPELGSAAVLEGSIVELPPRSWAVLV